jgi:glycosyltransferase involved in cell wall biosynthesis
MKILIGASSSKIFHLNEFSDALNELGIITKVVYDADYSDGFPSRKIKNWFKSKKTFKKLIQDFKPDLILIDRQRHFGLDAINEKIPLVVHLRGNYWKEMEIASKTIYKSLPKKIALNSWKQIGKKCLDDSICLIPICNYLNKITKEKYPEKNSFVMYQGINPSNWYPEKGIQLEHPCVGLLQGAVIWDKTKELLTLTKVLKKLPNVKFYWVGDGPFTKDILVELDKFKNFKWLGALQYPNEVRKYLSEIDMYALISGLDMSPLTLLEAQLMKKPVIATNVGGISELMVDGKTGFLIEKNNPEKIVEKILELLDNKEKSNKFGEEGRKFVENNFSWNIIANKFAVDIKKLIDKK